MTTRFGARAAPPAPDAPPLRSRHGHGGEGRTADHRGPDPRVVRVRRGFDPALLSLEAVGRRSNAPRRYPHATIATVVRAEYGLLQWSRCDCPTARRPAAVTSSRIEVG